MTAKWEVQTYFFFGGWKNCWTVMDNEGNETPEYYDTEQDAIDALEDYLDDVAQAIDDGDLEGPLNPEDYRVMEVQSMPSVSEVIDLFFAELQELGYQPPAVMKANHITDDEDLILFALMYLKNRIDDALIDGHEQEIKEYECMN